MFLHIKKFLYDWGLTVLFAVLALVCFALTVVALMMQLHKSVVVVSLLFAMVFSYGSGMSNPAIYRNSKP